MQAVDLIEFYGIQTLLQLSQPSGTGYSIASVEVQDSPRFAYRGLMLDFSESKKEPVPCSIFRGTGITDCA